MPNKRKKILYILAGLGIYLLATGISYGAFTALARGSIFTSPLPAGQEEGEESADRKALIDITGPKNETCLLNGAKFTKAEKNVWETRRPLAVMIENHEESRPQSGLTDADIVYEAVAEGGITRFMGLYFSQAAAYELILGPVRSARTYFLDWASEYNFPLYVHVGGANTPGPANALGQITTYGWSAANDLNQFSIGFPTFWRDYERLGRTVATEHTMYSTTEKLWAVGKKRGYTSEGPEGEQWSDAFKPWEFTADEADFADRGDLTSIDYNFWDDSAYEVSWQYDKEGNFFKRFNGGQPHQDLNLDQQLTAKNVVIQFASERNANDGYPGNVHLVYGTTGTGKALIVIDGKTVEGSWAKSSRLSRTIFYDESGKEIAFNPGKIWISVLPIGTQVDY